ncbi:MAG: transposase, partial [Bacillota bacterium]|nr:transposase [Bacillota bacterium]
NNLATCVDSDGSSFIIDGKTLKSRNQFYHKKMARLSSQNAKTPKTLSRRQIALIMKRNDQVKYYMNKSARMIVEYVLKHKIAEIIIGNNEDFQSGGLSKKNLPRRIKGQINQQFCALPLGQLRNRLEQLSNDYRIVFTLQEESYTSQASFYDKDEIPVFEKGTETKTGFQGRRLHRGLYVTKTGRCVNADVNAAFNIMKKSKPNTSFEKIWSRGASTPLRLRVI